METRRIVDRDIVRGAARELDPDIRVELEGDEIVISCGSVTERYVTERYDTGEEAIEGLRASWGAQPPIKPTIES